MPCFPEKIERVYRCQGCGKQYIQGNVSCCVAHPPGTCCHYGETPVVSEAKFGGGHIFFTERATYKTEA